MADYFLCLDAETFLARIRPALADSWRQRSFEPCLRLCGELLPAARDYSQRYHTGDEQPLVARIAEGLPFDRAFWRMLVGEVLLFAAVEIPEFPSNAETLCCLLAGESYQSGALAPRVPVHSRNEWTTLSMIAPIEQALHGGRDVTFGAAVYRPEQAGYNDVSDVTRLAAYLAAVEPQRWTVDDLRLLGEVEEDERADELAFAREWFPVLVELYQRAKVQRRVVIIESIY